MCITYLQRQSSSPKADWRKNGADDAVVIRLDVSPPMAAKPTAEPRLYRNYPQISTTIARLIVGFARLTLPRTHDLFQRTG